ncbi:MAG: hypothetical protein IKA77_04420 [Clostridia bacterium]|nr:hypothetical protein [Clostridia bacterium]
MPSKKKAAQLAAQQEAQRRSAAPRVTFRVMNNCAPVPVAKPADFIQLTPVVQPIPIVPYSSQMQPLAQFEDEEYYDED